MKLIWGTRFLLHDQKNIVILGKVNSRVKMWFLYLNILDTLLSTGLLHCYFTCYLTAFLNAYNEALNIFSQSYLSHGIMWVTLAFGSQQGAPTVCSICLAYVCVVRITIAGICKGCSVFLVSGCTLVYQIIKRIYNLLREIKYIHENNFS